MKVDYSTSPCKKANSKWIEELNIRSEKIYYIEQNIGTKLMDPGCREYFIIVKKDFIYLFLEGGREGEREGEKH